ncbi:MAG: carboxypeptidase-like regulatory domain-containing protein [Methanobacteriota archaeon]
MLRPLAVAILVLPASCFPLPVVGAQAPPVVPAQIEVFLEDPGPPLGAGLQPNKTLFVNYRYERGGFARDPVRIHLQVEEAPSWATVVVDPVDLEIQIPPENLVSGTTVQALANVSINVSETAPAFETARLTIVATAPPAGNLGAARGNQTRDLFAGFFPRVNATTPERNLSLVGGLAYRIPVMLRNDGNDATEVEVFVLEKLEQSEVSPTISVLLGRPGAPDGSDEATVDVFVKIAWAASRQSTGVMRIQVNTTHPQKPGLSGEPVTLDYNLSTRSLTPAPQAPGALLALGLAALIATRRRRPPAGVLLVALVLLLPCAGAQAPGYSMTAEATPEGGAYRLSGLVRDTDGAPAPASQIIVVVDEEHVSFHAGTRSDGTYEATVGVGPEQGRHRVEVVAAGTRDGGEEILANASLEVVIGSPDRLRLLRDSNRTVPPWETVRGRVAIVPPASGHVHLVLDPPGHDNAGQWADLDLSEDGTANFSRSVSQVGLYKVRAIAELSDGSSHWTSGFEFVSLPGPPPALTDLAPPEETPFYRKLVPGAGLAPFAVAVAAAVALAGRTGRLRRR